MIVCPSCSSEAPEESRFCNSCGAALPPPGTPPTEAFQQRATASIDPNTPPPPSSAGGDGPSSTSSSPHGRFLPGTMLASRYRIVALLGAGGMGEVYRADDLKLGQAVALKFLPRKLAGDVDRLAYFHNEVRLARGVSHPNVCRVYDIGEVEGEHFISMEYVDGEDLASLLRRIGRLPPDKGVSIAQQLCAGLAAAHDLGVLHRDLKPANIMIDGRGRARITDFGLAKLADDMGRRDTGAGTPAYMAPEQLAGRETNVRSDIYSLGLVLYELFTGQRAFAAGTRAELARLQADSTPPTPSSLVSDIDPTVERVILRCLESVPAERPASALAVAAALPGGDPLAAALAAGETPAPEMVAAAGGRGGLDPRIGGATLAAIIVSLLAIAWLSDKVSLIGEGALPMKPAALEQKARDIIAELGYDDPENPPVDSAYGFSYDLPYLRHARQRELPFSVARSRAVAFWYRQSPQPLTPQQTFETDLLVFARGKVTPQDPPTTAAGMVSISLDPRGNLLEFMVVPPRVHSAAVDTQPADWQRLFALADLDLADFSEQQPTMTPPVHVDRHTAWARRGPENRADALETQIEAGTYGGKVAYFQIAAPWDDPEYHVTANEYVGIRLIHAIYLVTWIVSIVLATGNIRSRRVDYKGSARLAIFVFSVLMLRWVFEASHRVEFPHEPSLFYFAFVFALYSAGIFWLMYVALEPYVRRLWPQTLISWNRVLAGRLRDPLVGRDLLVGTLFGVVWSLLGVAGEWAGMWTFALSPAFFGLESLMGVRHMVGVFFWWLRTGAIQLPLLVLASFLLLRILLRKPWAAAAAFWFIYTVYMASLTVDATPLWWTVAGLIALSWLVLMTRFGLLAFAACMLVRILLLQFPMTADLQAWYVGGTFFVFAVVIGFAAYGFYTSLAGRPLFREELMAR